MSMFQRAQSVVASNFNALLRRMEEPGRDLANVLGEMAQQITAAQRELVAVMGEAKREEAKAAAVAEEVSLWERRAELAVRMSDDALAREALEKKRRLLADQQRGNAIRSELLSAAAAMKAQIDRMKASYQSYEQRQHVTATLVAQARAGGKVEHLGQVGSKQPFEAFERLSSAVEREEVEALAQAEVDDVLQRTALGSMTQTELDERFRKLEEDARVADARISAGPEASSGVPGTSQGAGEAEVPVRIRVEP